MPDETAVWRHDHVPNVTWAGMTEDERGRLVARPRTGRKLTGVYNGKWNLD
jgi:hypothetical protein